MKTAFGSQSLDFVRVLQFKMFLRNNQHSLQLSLLFLFSNTASRLNGGSARCKGSAFVTKLLELLLVERLNALALPPRFLETLERFPIYSFFLLVVPRIMIEHESHLFVILLRHLFLGMQHRRFRNLRLAPDTNFCCCFKLSNFITHHGLLLQDVLVGDVHNLLIGYRKEPGPTQT